LLRARLADRNAITTAHLLFSVRWGAEDNSTPVADSGEHPLRENWFRKRDVAREYAFPQKHAWVRKQAKLNNTY